MANDAVDRFIARIEPMSAPLRMRTAALYARELASHGGLSGVPTHPAASGQLTGQAHPGRLADVLTDLASRGWYERRLAVHMAGIGGDTDFVLALFDDADPTIRKTALAMARSLPVPAEALAAALTDGSADTRRAVCVLLRLTRRVALADRLVAPIRERYGDAEAARLVPACSPAVAAAVLPDVFHAVTGWTTLARIHPTAVLDEAARQLGALPLPLRARWWAHYSQGVATTVNTHPERVLDLLERYGPVLIPPAIADRFTELAAIDAGRLLRLVLAPERRTSAFRLQLRRSFLERLVRQNPPELIELGRALRQNTVQYARLLRFLPPSRRSAFHDASSAGEDQSSAIIPDMVLALLPHERRFAEARRMTALAEARGDTWYEVASVQSFLPVPEVGDALMAHTRRPSAEDRALAYPLVIANAARSNVPATFTTVLRSLVRLANEQEPVRSPALEAVADTAPWLFDTDVAEVLDRMATDAVQARDSSGRTRQELSRLAVSLLRHNAADGDQDLVAWALRTWEQLAGSTGGANLGYGLDAKLRRGQEQAVFAALEPWIRKGAGRRDFQLTLGLARALRRRGWNIPALQDLLFDAYRTGNAATAQTAAELWLQDPRDRDSRVERLLDIDVSAARIPPVLEVLIRRRTDLLDRILGPTAPSGRFLLKNAARWVPAAGREIRGWTARQVEDYGKLLFNAASSASVPSHQRAYAIKVLAALPNTGYAAVLNWTDTPDVYLAEAALGALASTDRPEEALDVLLQHLADDRARVAVYAAGQVARSIRPIRLAEAFEAALSSSAKVTSRKEILRLAVRFSVPGDTGLLVDAWDAPGAHRDVRITVLLCVPKFLDDPAMWRIVEEAAAGSPETAAAVAGIDPFTLAERHRAAFADILAGLVSHRDPEVARPALAALPSWAAWSTSGGEAVVDVLTDLGRQGVWRQAAGALQGLAESGMADDAVGTVFATLAAAPETPDAEPTRDRPARQRLESLTESLRYWSLRTPQQAQPTLLRAGSELAPHDTFRPLQIMLLISAIDINAGQLREVAALHQGRPALARVTAGQLSARVTSAADTLDRIDDLLATAAELALDPDPVAAILAVALTRSAGDRSRWTPPWRQVLRTLREHRVPDVRDAALAVYTAHE